MRYLAVLLVCAGCASDPGNTCISDEQKVGDSITNPDRGQSGVVTMIYGPAKKCPYPKNPIAADVKYR